MERWHQEGDTDDIIQRDGIAIIIFDWFDCDCTATPSDQQLIFPIGRFRYYFIIPTPIKIRSSSATDHTTIARFDAVANVMHCFQSFIERKMSKTSTRWRWSSFSPPFFLLTHPPFESRCWRSSKTSPHKFDWSQRCEYNSGVAICHHYHYYHRVECLAAGAIFNSILFAHLTRLIACAPAVMPRCIHWYWWLCH